MVQGFWKVRYTSGIASGAGVIVLREGKVYGGNSSYHFLGQYRVQSNHQVSGIIEVNNHSGTLNSIFGSLRQFTLSFSGMAHDAAMALSGSMTEMPAAKFSAELVKIADC